ncbi:oxidoreductase, partial [cyanobacterium TDX16]
MLQIDGRVFARGDDGYEEARRATVWNGRLPDRFPDVVVQATSAADVQVAVRHATAEGLQVGVRSGGHSWAANHVRDGGLLLDVSRLDDVQLDVDGYSAVVGPGTGGHALCLQLGEVDRFFPS